MMDIGIFETVAATEPLCAPRRGSHMDFKKYFWPSLCFALAVTISGLIWWERRPRPPLPPPEPVPPALELPALLDCKAPDVFTLEAIGRAKVDGWLVDGDVKLREVHREGNLIKYFAPEKGKGSVFCYGIADGKAVLSRCLITVRGAEPVPPGPTPPGPTPPGPTPPPSPAPIPADGFRVLIVYETADRLPQEQQAILYSKVVRDYLNAKCVLGPDNKTREWRIYDKDIATDGESKIWQDAMKRPRSKLPWIVISTGKVGYEGPLPDTVDAALELLKKFGG